MRIRAEFFLVLVGNPAWLVTALFADVRQHRVPSRADRRISEIDLRFSIAIDEPELTVDEGYVSRWTLRQETAMRARFARDTDRAALRALD